MVGGKISTVTLFFYVVLFGNTAAQRLGPFMGISSSGFYGDEITTTKHRMSISVGLGIYQNKPKKFGFSTGILYEQAGAVSQLYPQKFRMGYLSIPVTARVRILDRNVAPVLLGGLGYKYLLSARNSYESIRPWLRTVDFQASIGIGMDISTKKGDLVVELKQNWGLVNIARFGNPYKHTAIGVQLIWLPVME